MNQIILQRFFTTRLEKIRDYLGEISLGTCVRFRGGAFPLFANAVDHVDDDAQVDRFAVGSRVTLALFGDGPIVSILFLVVYLQ